MELSIQGLVTDGVGKLSSTRHSPVGPSQESLPRFCLSFFSRLLFSVSLTLYFLASVSYLLCPSFVLALKYLNEFRFALIQLLF